MSRLQDPARVVWSLASSGLGTTITASGNSGPYNAQAQNAATAVDLRPVEDILLTVYVSGVVTGTTPALAVQLDLYDDAGHLIPHVLAATSLSAAGSVYVSGGLHGATATNSIVLPSWGRVSWQVTGTTPVFPNVEICLYGR